MYFKVVSCLKDRETPKHFSVSDLFKGEEDQVIAEKVADYFSKIGDKFTPLQDNQEGIDGND